MRFISKPPWSFIIVAILLFIILKHSFYLRSIGYDQIPETALILDERTNIWHGLSIRSSGIPAAWSSLGIYKDRGEGGNVVNLNLSVVQNDLTVHPNLLNFTNFPKPIWILYPFNFENGAKHISLVQPYLDHPPFGALVLSSFVASNVKTFTDLRPWEFRRGSLWMAVLTGILVFILGWQIFKNPLIGLLATLIYGTVPSFLLLSRYALLENVLNPLILLTISLIVFANKIHYPTSKFWSINPKIFILLAGVTSGLAALTKITGWSVLIIGLILLRYFKFGFKDSIFFIIPSLFLGGLYFLWGLFLSPKVFLDILYYQGIERGFIGSLNFLVSATGIGILNFPFDGWWVGGFLCLGFILAKKEYLYIFISVVVSLFAALFLGGANYPWYFIPLIPFMCLATAYFLWQVVTGPSFTNMLIFFLVFFSSSFYWGYGVYKAALESSNYQQPFGLYRLFLITFLIAGFVIPAIVKYKIFKYLWFTLVLIILLQLFMWNTQSLYYILAHWGKLPSLYTPGTF